MRQQPITGQPRQGPEQGGFDRAGAMTGAYSGGQYNAAIAGLSDDGTNRPGRSDRRTDRRGAAEVNESGFDHRAVGAAHAASEGAELDDGGGVAGAMGGVCDDG